MKKRLTSLLLSFILCAGLISPVFAVNSNFTIQNGVLTKYNGVGGSVTIPSGVTRIGDRAFFNCSGLTSVTIPEGVTSIGEYAFGSCSNLDSVVIPSSVSGTGAYAFSGCRNLTKVVIQQGVTRIDNKSFSWCESLTNVEIPSSVTSIGQWAFQSCTKLTSVIIPAGAGIGDYAFIDCTALKNAVIMSGTARIGRCAFAGCTSMTSVTIPASINTIADEAFFSTSLTDVYYGGSKEQWSAINIDHSYNRNQALISAVIHYNSASSGAVSSNGFADVPLDAFFADPVAWAVGHEITKGTSATKFSPYEDCTRAQILTFIWRAAGQPVPAISNPFRNVSTNDYYYSAALWASEKGMVTGDTFAGNLPCTRSMAVTYLWKASGSPFVPLTNQFSDVTSSAEYAQAVAWAVSNGITTGTGANTFSPNDVCNRGQIVTFLYRCRNFDLSAANPSSSNPFESCAREWITFSKSGDERALLRITNAAQSQFSCEVTFYRLGVYDFTGTVGETGRATLYDPLQGVSAELTLNGDQLLLTLEDVPNHYFDMSLSQFLGASSFVFQVRPTSGTYH